MEVKIVDFDENADIPYIDYHIFGLNDNQLNFLNDNLDDETKINNNVLELRVYFRDVFPFQSDIAKLKIDDFVAREEIEMTFFLLGYLEGK